MLYKIVDLLNSYKYSNISLIHAFIKNVSWFLSCLNNPDYHLILIRVASDTLVHFCIFTPIRCLVLSFKCCPLIFFLHWGGMVLNNSILCTVLSWALWVKSPPGTSLAVQRLGLHTSRAEGDMGLIPGQGTKILHDSLVFWWNPKSNN